MCAVGNVYRDGGGSGRGRGVQRYGLVDKGRAEVRNRGLRSHESG